MASEEHVSFGLRTYNKAYHKYLNEFLPRASKKSSEVLARYERILEPKGIFDALVCYNLNVKRQARCEAARFVRRSRELEKAVKSFQERHDSNKPLEEMV